ncbi:hypothetical protein DUGA2_58570 [Duganella sp. HH101]|nr:hypothetical protein DUGA2_58570 [Duganella sp. HH101]
MPQVLAVWQLCTQVGVKENFISMRQLIYGNLNF